MGGWVLYKDVEVSDFVLKFSLKLLIGIFLLYYNVHCCGGKKEKFV